MLITPLPGSQHAPLGFPPIVDAIGEPDFARRIGEHLRDLCGAVLFSAFRIHQSRARLVATFGLERPDMASDHANRYLDGLHWRHDPALTAAKEAFATHAALLVRLDPMKTRDSVLLNEFYGPAGARDKLAIYAKRGDEYFGLSILSTDEQGLADAAVTQISQSADLMISLIAKHDGLLAHHALPHANPLASVEAIEQELAAAPWGLTPRERQVCARILYGMMAEGIGLDLGIGEQSVATYRKRAYQRMGIATRHELLRAFLQFCAQEPRPQAA